MKFFSYNLLICKNNDKNKKFYKAMTKPILISNIIKKKMKDLEFEFYIFYL